MRNGVHDPSSSVRVTTAPRAIVRAVLHVARKIAAFGLRTTVDALGRGLNGLDEVAHGVERVCFALSAAEGRLLGAEAPELNLSPRQLAEAELVMRRPVGPAELAARIAAVYGSKAGVG